MTTATNPWTLEARALLALAMPLIVGNLAWSAIAAVDLIWLGELGSDAVGAGALALNLYNALMVFGMGLSTAVSPMIASERGRRIHPVRDVRRTMRQAMWSIAIISLPVWLLLWYSEDVLILMGQEPALARDAALIMHGLQWAFLPYLLFYALRNYIGALERPMSGVLIVVAAIPVNALVGWVLIFGHLGFPAMGLFGAGLASSLTAGFMFAAMLAVILTDRQFRRYSLLVRFWAPDWPRFRYLWSLGLPIAVTLALEVTVFNASAFLMGLLDRASLAAHAIAIQLAALCFMVPLGIGQAATVRVGMGYGRGDGDAVARAGWLAIALGLAFAVVTAILLVAFPRQLIGLFIDVAAPANADVVRIAISFLMVAALFQLVDCTQAIGAGVLRGLHDTRVPMAFAAVGYWVIGIGVGAFLAFRTPLRGTGLWLGLAAGLAAVAILMVVRWAMRERLRLVA
ncbi:MATE family efflux transporter [Sphingomonas montanisoli]|uniref:Multidrug-efflux transporter n=1 Tax=Sphingomonas montanisoli TaxID=2606412 RepID=A0A5D9C435_9SPHN|nr:MATE family efflux transporter [Sphingomonas montanisoli]TZG24675.1 MATE family efflux transporter [Sphingomonas montanisoli]